MTWALTPVRLGVLAILAVLMAWMVEASAAELRFPQLTGRVVDEAELLSPIAEQRLSGWLAELERAKGTQVVVVTVPSLQGVPIEDYGYRLGRSWGIGEAGRNTGAILLVAPTERTVRIEVGYGLEGTLTDALSRAIIEEDILPAFRTGDFERGILAGAASLLRTLGFEPADAPAREPRGQEPTTQDSVISFIFVGIILLMFFLNRGSRGRRRSSVLPYMIAGWAAGSMGRGRGDSDGGLGGGGGGFSGGGGSFGGGGATGRW
jgi:uncharacterized protein